MRFYAIVKLYFDIFSKHKCNVGQISSEPQRNFLNLILPISLNLYRTSFNKENRINNKTQCLVEAGLIKERNSTLSSPVTKAMKCDQHFM